MQYRNAVHSKLLCAESVFKQIVFWEENRKDTTLLSMYLEGVEEYPTRTPRARTRLLSSSYSQGDDGGTAQMRS